MNQGNLKSCKICKYSDLSPSCSLGICKFDCVWVARDHRWCSQKPFLSPPQHNPLPCCWHASECIVGVCGKHFHDSFGGMPEPVRSGSGFRGGGGRDCCTAGTVCSPNIRNAFKPLFKNKFLTWTPISMVISICRWSKDKPSTDIRDYSVPSGLPD